MKAHVAAGTVLFCGFSAPEQAVLEDFCRSRRVLAREVSPALRGQTLGALLGLPGSVPAPAAVSSPAAADSAPAKALVFSAFSDAALDRLLSALRAQRLGADALKAVVTPTNRSWTFAALLDELAKERAHFAQQQEASDAVPD